MAIAEIIPPNAMQKKDFLKSSPINAATALPVQSPVVGIGMATKIINPISLYLSIFADPFLTLFSTKLLNGFKNLNFLSQLKIMLNKSKINGTGRRLPKKLTKAAAIGLN